MGRAEGLQKTSFIRSGNMQRQRRKHMRRPTKQGWLLRCYLLQTAHPLYRPPPACCTAPLQVIQKLALESCRDIQIGNPLVKGISGGQVGLHSSRRQ